MFNAGAVELRLNVAARPNATLGVLGIVLGATIHALGKTGPIKCMSVADKPVAEIGAIDRTPRHCSAVLILGDGNTPHRAARDEGVQLIGRFRPATIWQAVIATAQLIAIWSIDAPDADSGAVNFDRIAVDNASPADLVGSESFAGARDQRQQGATQYRKAARRKSK